MAKNRYIGEYPVIGIRPIIDGRRGGIRESLEAMTMGMAQRVARLYSEELRYSDGSPVECVIADTTIGGVAEAAACTDKFRDSNVGAVLSVTPCWCYGSETMDMDPLTPKAVWGFNGTERPGAVYLAAVLAAHAQGNMSVVTAADIDVKARKPVRPDDVFRAALRGGIIVAEPENGLGDALERIARALIVHIGDDVSANGNELGKAAERMLHIR